MDSDRDVLILGGGFAGLSCAAALAQAGLRVTVIEKKPHLGGRAYSFVDPDNGQAVDNGQHLFMGCYRHTRLFLARINATDKLTFLNNIRVDFVDAQARRSALRCPAWLGSPLHFAAGVLGLGGLSLSDKLGLRRLNIAFNGHDAGLWDHLTVHDWLKSLGQSDRIQDRLFNPIALGVLNEDPKIASATGLVQALREMFFRGVEGSRLGLSRVGLSELYTQDAQAFIEKKGGQVILSKSAAGFLEENGRVVGVVLENGEVLNARAVVSTLPPWDLARLKLPDGLSTPWEKLSAAPIVSIGLWLDRPILDDEPLVGMINTDIQWVFNKSRILGHNGSGQCLSLVISGAHRQVNLSPKELIAIAERDLARCFPAFQQAKVLHSRVIKEPRATLSPVPGSEGLRPTPGEAYPGLFLAGDWTRTSLPATIESAVASGHAVTDSILKKSPSLTKNFKR